MKKNLLAGLTLTAMTSVLPINASGMTFLLGESKLPYRFSYQLTGRENANTNGFYLEYEFVEVQMFDNEKPMTGYFFTIHRSKPGLLPRIANAISCTLDKKVSVGDVLNGNEPNSLDNSHKPLYFSFLRE